MMLIMYKTLVRPILDYCIPVWKPHNKKDILQLEKIQKGFTKIVLGYKKLTYALGWSENGKILFFIFFQLARYVKRC